MEKIAVLGCGLMGGGITQVCAQAGLEVHCYEIDSKALEKGVQKIEKNLGKMVEKGKLPASERGGILKRIHPTSNLKDVSSCDFVIEAIIEDIKIKQKTFQELDQMMGPEVIFASNTSSLTIMEIAAATKRPDRFVGMHFFNPVPVMKLVEVVRTLTTSQETFEATFSLAQKLGKQPIKCKDNSGFVVNLLLVPYLLGSIRALENHVASVEDIDKGMMLGCGHPMGPLTLLDFVGLDTTLYIAEIMFKEYRDSLYAPPPLLRKMVLAGYHGKKSGRGFYDYSGEKPVVADLIF